MKKHQIRRATRDCVTRIVLLEVVTDFVGAVSVRISPSVLGQMTDNFSLRILQNQDALEGGISRHPNRNHGKLACQDYRLRRQSRNSNGTLLNKGLPQYKAFLKFVSNRPRVILEVPYV
jgi:hypothetical protein